MIAHGNKERTALWIGAKAVSMLWLGARLIFTAIRGCFGSGSWRSDEPWHNDDFWIN